MAIKHIIVVIFFIYASNTYIASFVCCINDKYNDRANMKSKGLYWNDFFSEDNRLFMKSKVRDMFYFGYNNYMKHAFPLDELNPIYCTGRGPDKENPDNININDVLGGYSLTLIDSLDTLAILGNHSEFYRAVKLVLEYVNFDQDNVVQVFEATIRVLGGLLAAHLLIVDPQKTFGNLFPEEEYDNDLLTMAHELGNRMLPAFESTKTGIPWPRVNLKYGVPSVCATTTCTAGAGTLVLEFGVLGSLLQDPTFEKVARKAISAVWNYRSNSTGLFGNVIDIQSGEWVGKMSGLGAGIDSFYEYLLKSFILFGEQEDLNRFNAVYGSITKFMKKGGKSCMNKTVHPTFHVNVHMDTGETANTWIDSLQASFIGVQVLRGDIEDAICSHALYYKLWQRYNSLPERFNWHLKAPDVRFYPLRPEFIEATYLLYQATKQPFYLHVGVEIYNSLETFTKAKCGYGTIHDVMDKSLEDRMESFFLSETVKYLYLLFDFENPLNKDASNWIFSTEGHIFKVEENYRNKQWRDEILPKTSGDSILESAIRSQWNSTTEWNCNFVDSKRFPLHDDDFYNIEKFVGLR